jgi:hypothetical protein
VVSSSLSWAVQQSHHGEPSFDVVRVWRGYIGARDDGVLRGQNRLELVAVLRGRLCAVVSYGSCLFVLLEDGLAGGSCVSEEGLAGWWLWGVGTLLG